MALIGNCSCSVTLQCDSYDQRLCDGLYFVSSLVWLEYDNSTVEYPEESTTLFQPRLGDMEILLVLG